MTMAAQLNLRLPQLQQQHQQQQLPLHLARSRRLPLLFVSILLAFISSVAQPLSAAEAKPSSTEQIHQELRDANPVWYDKQSDHWQRGELPPPEPEIEPGQRKLLSNIFFIFVFVTIIALLLYIAYLILNHLRNKKPPQKTARAANIAISSSDLQHLPVDQESDSNKPLHTLQQALAQQDWNKVIVYCLVVLLVELHHAQLLTISRGKTNGDYLRHIRQQAPRHTQILQRSIHAFESSYFGHQPIDSASAQALAQHVTACVATLSRPASSAELAVPRKTAHV